MVQFSNEQTSKLLLSYTYFINQKTNNAFISIGFDVTDFECKIIIFNRKKQFTFRKHDWHHLYKNVNIIDTFFESNKEVTIENGYGCVEINLKEKHGKRRITLGIQRVALNNDEWTSIRLLFNYFNDIMNWNSGCEKSVHEYYSKYVRECVRLETTTLDPNMVLEVEDCKFFNVRRLHTEIPFLMFEKLERDCFLYQLYGN